MEARIFPKPSTKRIFTHTPLCWHLAAADKTAGGCGRPHSKGMGVLAGCVCVFVCVCVSVCMAASVRLRVRVLVQSHT